MDARWGRVWFAATAVAVAVGVVIEMVLAWQHATFRLPTGELRPRFGGSPVNRSLNTLAYFTILSNLIVGVTSLLLAIRTNRSSTVFRVVWLTGLVAITLTFLVFHVALSGLLDLESWAKVSNTLLHTAVPIMAVAGWLMFGPRGLSSARIARLTAIFPACYMAFTMIRGPFASHWYPYPFTDVAALGYARVIVNGVWIGLLFVALAAASTFVDKRLTTKS